MICPLFQSEHEQTYLEKLKPDQIFVEKSEQGIELFIIKGQLFCGTEIYPAGSWVRLPLNSAAKFQAGPSGATLYVKTGHLQVHLPLLKPIQNVMIYHYISDLSFFMYDRLRQIQG